VELCPIIHLLHTLCTLYIVQECFICMPVVLVLNTSYMCLSVLYVLFVQNRFKVLVVGSMAILV